MAYASAKFAKALCDRCGFEYKLLDLKKEWNNLKTCPDCFETKHPQLEPKPAYQIQKLYTNLDQIMM